MSESSLGPCTNCGQRPAVIHLTNLHFGSKKIRELCQICFDAASRLESSLKLDFLEAWKNANCKYCGGKAVAGGTDTFRLLTGSGEEYRFMCRSCSAEFNRVALERLGALEKKMSDLPAPQQTQELRTLVDGVELHMKQWLGQRFN
jgi:protein-arginine kinase activator protein McsA